MEKGVVGKGQIGVGGRERERRERRVIDVDGIRRGRERRRFAGRREMGELTLDVGDGLDLTGNQCVRPQCSQSIRWDGELQRDHESESRFPV